VHLVRIKAQGSMSSFFVLYFKCIKALGKEEENKINLAHLLDLVRGDLVDVRDFATGQKIINYFKSEDYLSKLRFFQYERPPYTVTKETRSGSPLMIGNKEGFKTELEKNHYYQSESWTKHIAGLYLLSSRVH
jgi:hypothetical protein